MFLQDFGLVSDLLEHISLDVIQVGSLELSFSMLNSLLHHWNCELHFSRDSLFQFFVVILLVFIELSLEFNQEMIGSSHVLLNHFKQKSVVL